MIHCSWASDGVEVLADRAQRDVDDRAVEQRHARAEASRPRSPRGRAAYAHPIRLRATASRLGHHGRPRSARPRGPSVDLAPWRASRDRAAARGARRPARRRSTRRSTSTRVDCTVRDPATLAARFGHVLDYMARVELEVDRNVLELTTMLPDPPEVDRRFYADVWQPQEIRHGLILDELQVAARPAARRRRPRHRLAPSSGSSARSRHLDRGPGRQPDALLPDRHGHRALRGAGLQPAPRRRRRARRDRRRRDGRRADPPPGARPLRLLQAVGASGSPSSSRRWQRWLVRRLRQLSFAPVGANDDAAEGRLRRRDGDPRHHRRRRRLRRARSPASSASCCGPQADGMRVPAYVLAAFREAVELAAARRSA